MIMKKLMFIAAMAAFILMDVTASAQFVQSSGKPSGTSSAADPEALFSTVDFTYSPMTINASSGNGSDSADMTGLSINWSQARLLTNQLPLYLQYGAGLQYSWYKDSDSYEGDYYSYSYSATTSFLTLSVPVNVVCNFAVPNTPISVMPYLGLSANLHILGQTTTTMEEDGVEESKTYSFFSEDDMGSSSSTYNRFVLGWQVGAMVSLDKYFLRFGYSGPVTNLYSQGEFKINTSQVNLSIGLRF